MNLVYTTTQLCYRLHKEICDDDEDDEQLRKSIQTIVFVPIGSS